MFSTHFLHLKDIFLGSHYVLLLYSETLKTLMDSLSP